MDFTVLNTLAPLIQGRKIKRIQCTVTRDGRHNIYTDLPSNEFQKFRQLLEPNGYRLTERENVPDDQWEFPANWVINESINT